MRKLAAHLLDKPPQASAYRRCGFPPAFSPPVAAYQADGPGTIPHNRLRH